MQFPYLEASGSYEDIGHAIGEMMRIQIQTALSEDKKEIPDYPGCIEKSKKYYEFTKTIFPQFVAEHDAICEAAGVNKYAYFLSNNREVYDVAETYDIKHAVSHDHCTIAVSFSPSGVIVGHNED